MRKTVIGILILTLLCSLVPMSAFASPVPRGWDDGIMPLYVAFTHTYCDMSVSGTTGLAVQAVVVLPPMWTIYR